MSRSSKPMLVRTRLVSVIAVGVLAILLSSFGFAGAVPVLLSATAVVAAGVEAVSMVRSMLHRRFGVDLLAVTAIVATLAVGEWLAAFVIVLMLVGGEALEAHAQRRATSQLSRLLSDTPKTAHRMTGETVVDVPVGDVLVGDVLVVRPFEVVPVDGALVAGAATFDESRLTGESVPVGVSAGANVPSGAVNGAAAVLIRASRPAAASEYQQIVALVSGAMSSRSPMVRLADQYAPWFTAFALVLGGIAWWVAGDPRRFAEVLVLATPCPMLIAAPVAFLGGIGRAARSDVVLKDASVLERLAAVRTVVFDKTGTLTMGRPTLERVVTVAGGPTRQRLLELAASAEQYSSHTLAASIVDAARAEAITLTSANHAAESESDGVAAEVDGHEVAVGTLAFARRRAAEAAPAEVAGGRVVSYILVDGAPAGALVLRDPIRPEAPATVVELRQLGIRDVVMLTGDARATAEAVAADVGVAVLRAECRPGDKVTAVRELTERPVLMIGDGVNDAPVLAVADVGVAMGARGASAASETADAVVLVESVERVAVAVRIGRETVRIARQSIWIGMGASVGLMLVASTGVVPAVVGALLQELVDVVTILAALRATTGGTAHVRGAAPVRRSVPAR
ncbi:heavy metal translocating P-type ATPase [Curtobacterium sp. PhB115]|uniref:heavy metal translocating P-type ATPase n=1 Tax=Curtobacterium sp. PhB115 TaxID=2485173 RepID=UPI000F4CDEFC|nr:heavy metal translocating P-type ATPase [Curtobacterium sp. PhB115]ROP58639.1 heavy metal-(Cd/Co/Hg/Pb/Zn)-translocating P-type ATPase [Curtobacterium sp. PhB115]